MDQLLEQRAPLKTAFAVIPQKDPQVKQERAESVNEDDRASSKRVHPFFPDVAGLRPLLGIMKEQLGEFPNFVKNPPDDAECEELRLEAPPDWHKKHILEICGSSSDDDFDPDGPLEANPGPLPWQHGMTRPI
jgi:hypothetical protein